MSNLKSIIKKKIRFKKDVNNYLLKVGKRKHYNKIVVSLLKTNKHLYVETFYINDLSKPLFKLSTIKLKKDNPKLKTYQLLGHIVDSFIEQLEDVQFNDNKQKSNKKGNKLNNESKIDSYSYNSYSKSEKFNYSIVNDLVNNSYTIKSNYVVDNSIFVWRFYRNRFQGNIKYFILAIQKIFSKTEQKS